MMNPNDQQNEDPGPPTLFNERLLELIEDSRRACSNMWPGQDSPASAMEAIHKGVEAGLDERMAMQEMLNELGPNYTKAMQAAMLWKQMADIREVMIKAVHDQDGLPQSVEWCRAREAAIQEDLDEMTEEPERRQTDLDEELKRRLGNNDSPQ